MSLPTVATVPWRDRRVGLAVIAGTFSLWTAVTWAAAWASGYSPQTTSTWARFDSWWYVFVAQHGYTLSRCHDIPYRTPTDYCGAAGWFPGYAYAIRGLDALGIGAETGGRLLSLACFAATLAVLWFAFLRYLSPKRALTGMVLAAVFPGAVYYGAVFPISIVTLTAFGTLALMRRQRWLLAGLCGAIGAMCYPSGAVVAIGALALLLPDPVTPMRVRVRRAGAVGGPVIAAYGLVLLNYQRAVGHWDAWFKVQAAYGYRPTLPMVTYGHHAKALITGSVPRWPSAQTMLVLAIILVATIVAWREWPRLQLAERAAASMAAAWWFVPLTLGSGLSLYRAEALVLPVVLLVTRARRPALTAVTAACAVTAFFMARLFFESVLV